MSFLSELFNALTSLFSGNSPEAQQKNDLRHLETSLKQHQPVIYRNRMLQPYFAEAFRLLDEHTQPVTNILSDTIFNSDAKRSQYFINILIETGFSDRAVKSRQRIAYDERKEDFLSQPNSQRCLDSHKNELNTILREINSPTFRAIEHSLQTLDILYDICRFQYPLLLKQFDPEYSSITAATAGNFQPVEIERIEHLMLDFYFLMGNFKLTATEGRAIEALMTKRKGSPLSPQESETMQHHLRAISSVLTQIIPAPLILDLIRMAKNDPHYQAKTSLSQKRYLEPYATHFKAQFDNDTKRLTSEIQDERITSETNQLFNGMPLAELSGYTQQNSSIFRNAGSGSFLWILPLQIIKSFTQTYLDGRVSTFLNDVVVEGYFLNSQFKTEFSESVFAGLDVANQLRTFEKTFEKGEKNSIAVMEGYIRDSSSDPSFMKNLDKMIEEVNTEAKKLIQSMATTIYQLYSYLGNIIPDSKKSSPEIVSNIKGFFTSSRNHDNAAFLESSLPQWKIFIDIMRNYAIIGEVREEIK